MIAIKCQYDDVCCNKSNCLMKDFNEKLESLYKDLFEAKDREYEIAQINGFKRVGLDGPIPDNVRKVEEKYKTLVFELVETTKHRIQECYTEKETKTP